MTTIARSFLIKILSFSVGIFLLNLCYQQFIVSDFFISNISKSLFRASRHSPALAFKPARIAQGRNLMRFKSENVIAGTSITQDLFFGNKISGYRFVTIPENYPFMAYFYISEILEQPTKKIKLVVSVPHFVPHGNSRELQFSMPPPLHDALLFLDKSSDWMDTLERIDYKFAAEDLLLLQQLLAERIIFRHNAFSNVPGIIIESHLRKNLPRKKKLLLDTKIQGTKEILFLNYKIFDFMLERLVSRNIKFYIIEDRSRADCELTDNPAIREFFIQLNQELKQKHDNFVFIPRESLPVIDGDNYRDCLHVKTGHAPWKQQKINFIRDL